jgi:flagellar biosynthesis protein FliR
MENLIGLLAESIPPFLLVLARILGLFLQAPILSSRNLPGILKMALAIAISIVVMMVLPAYQPLPSYLLPYVFLALIEYGYGALIGFGANFMFWAIQSAGEFAGVQAGLSFASTMNPFIKSNVNPFGTLFLNIATISFLILGGHRYLLDAFITSFKILPLGTIYFSENLAKGMIDLSANFFIVTLQLSLPLVIVLFMVDLAIGYINKAAQQASNLTELIQVLKPLVGLLILLGFLPNLLTVTHKMTEQSVIQLLQFVKVSH